VRWWKDRWWLVGFRWRVLVGAPEIIALLVLLLYLSSSSLIAMLIIWGVKFSYVVLCQPWENRCLGCRVHSAWRLISRWGSHRRRILRCRLLLIHWSNLSDMINNLSKVVNRRQSYGVHAMHGPAMAYFTSDQAWAAKHNDGYILDLLIVLRLA
jgi:hypothetical protein